VDELGPAVSNGDTGTDDAPALSDGDWPNEAPGDGSPATAVARGDEGGAPTKTSQTAPTRSKKFKD